MFYARIIKPSIKKKTYNNAPFKKERVILLKLHFIISGDFDYK